MENENIDQIQDGEDRECQDCGNTTFHRSYRHNLITCNVCCARYDAFRLIDKLFRDHVV